jgi:hypothetical protein
LLDALTVAYLEACETARHAIIEGTGDDEGDDEFEPTAAEMTAYRLLRNRLFTSI